MFLRDLSKVFLCHFNLDQQELQLLRTAAVENIRKYEARRERQRERDEKSQIVRKDCYSQCPHGCNGPLVRPILHTRGRCNDSECGRRRGCQHTRYPWAPDSGLHAYGMEHVLGILVNRIDMISRG